MRGELTMKKIIYITVLAILWNILAAQSIVFADSGNEVWRDECGDLSVVYETVNIMQDGGNADQFDGDNTRYTKLTKNEGTLTYKLEQGTLCRVYAEIFVYGAEPNKNLFRISASKDNISYRTVKTEQTLVSDDAGFAKYILTSEDLSEGYQYLKLTIGTTAAEAWGAGVGCVEIEYNAAYHEVSESMEEVFQDDCASLETLFARSEHIALCPGKASEFGGDIAAFVRGEMHPEEEEYVTYYMEDIIVGFDILCSAYAGVQFSDFRIFLSEDNETYIEVSPDQMIIKTEAQNKNYNAHQYTYYARSNAYHYLKIEFMTDETMIWSPNTDCTAICDVQIQTTASLEGQEHSYATYQMVDNLNKSTAAQIEGSVEFVSDTPETHLGDTSRIQTTDRAALTYTAGEGFVLTSVTVWGFSEAEEPGIELFSKTALPCQIQKISHGEAPTELVCWNRQLPNMTRQVTIYFDSSCEIGRVVLSYAKEGLNVGNPQLIDGLPGIYVINRSIEGTQKDAAVLSWWKDESGNMQYSLQRQGIPGGAEYAFTCDAKDLSGVQMVAMEYNGDWNTVQPLGQYLGAAYKWDGKLELNVEMIQLDGSIPEKTADKLYLLLLNKEDEPVLAEKIPVEQGAVSGTYAISPQIQKGAYTLVLTGEGMVPAIAQTVYIAPQEDRDAVLEKLRQSAQASEFAAIIADQTQEHQYCQILKEMGYMSEAFATLPVAVQEDIAAKMLGIPEDVQQFNCLTTPQWLAGAANELELTQMLKQLEDYGIGTKNQELQTFKKQISMEYIGTYLWKNQTFSDYEIFMQGYEAAILTGVIQQAEYSEIHKLLHTYYERFGISPKEIGDYEQLSETRKIQICKKIEIAAFASAEEVGMTFRTAYQNAIVPQGGSGGGTGGSSSGNSGGITNILVPQSTAQPEDKAPRFLDMDQAVWAEEYVNYLLDRDMIAGDGDGNYRPNDAVLREEFVQMLVSCLNLWNDKPPTFLDVSEDAWYRRCVGAAEAAGIISGISEGIFGVHREITRQEMAVMVLNAIQKMQIPLSKEEEGIFADIEQIAPWAREAVEQLRRAGIVNGNEEQCFQPGKSLTRAEAAKILYELIVRTER